jgi:hypothetical protein
VKLRHFLILSGGLLAGLFADAGRWIFETPDWNAGLPWALPGGVVSNGVTLGLCLLLAVAAAWVLSALPGKRGWIMLSCAVALCFTGAAAVSLHEVGFDPFPPVFALALGALVATAVGRWWSHQRPDLAGLFVGQLSPEALAVLDSQLLQEDLACENRPVWLLGVMLHEASVLRKKLGPSAFLTLTGEFRKRASSLLLTRQALVLPDSGEIVWAAFGLPQGSADAGAKCVESAELLRTALVESFPAPAEFCFAVQYGLAASGVVNGAYQVSGEVLTQGRQLLEVAFLGQMVTDEVTANLLLEDAVPLAQVTADQRAVLEIRLPSIPEPAVAEPSELEPEPPAKPTPKPSMGKTSGQSKGKKKRKN